MEPESPPPPPPPPAAAAPTPLLPAAAMPAPEHCALALLAPSPPPSQDVETIPGIAAGVTARLGAVLRGHFAFAARDGALVDAATAVVGNRHDVLWWEPAAAPPACAPGSWAVTPSGWRVHRDAGVRLYERDYLARNADLYGPGGPFGDSAPTSGHHALVDPRVVPTPHRKPGFDHNTFWSAAFWLGFTRSTGSAAWDADFAGLAAAAALYTAPCARQCNACFRRTALDPATGAHAPLTTCASCRAVYYCGRECQRHDWRAAGHRERCPALAAAAAPPAYR